LKPSDAADRIRYLLETLDKAEAVAIIPTPVLSELLAGGGPAVADVLLLLQNAGRFRIAPFDQRAAVECGSMIRQALLNGPKPEKGRVPKSRIKFDSQIVSIAKTEEATTIYSDDEGVRKLGRSLGIDVLGVWDLPQRPTDPQGKLALDSE
jgi:hypothetical protein